jgi:Uma2 family endonuclease
MSVISTTKMTARQFLMLGEDPPGVRLELVDGEIAVSPSPIPDHSYVDTQLQTILNTHVRARDLGMIFGDVDTIFGEQDVRRPDIIYFSKARCHLIGKRAIKGPPDLCVEILSPSSVRTDRKDKFKLYSETGVRFYWIVDPEARSIEAYRLTGGKYRLIGKGSHNDCVRLAPFPELVIHLDRIWFPLRDED